MSAHGTRGEDREERPLLRVLIAEDDARMRLALREVVAAAAGLELCGVVEDADQAIVLAERLRPQVCVLDVRMPGGGGPRATREIRARSPWTRIVALSGYQDRETVVEMLRAGASAYLVKGAAPEELVATIEAVAGGHRTVSRQVADGVVGELVDKLAQEEADEWVRRDELARVERVLRDGLMSVLFQPIVALADRRVTGYETLARFDHAPARAPDVWFGEAARSGRSLELELAAVREGLEGLAHLPPELFVSVNVSLAAAACPELALALDGHDGRRVVLEITEHAPIEDYDALADRLRELRARGVRVAIDDAGSGFASLRHILRLAPDIIKIDMTLTRHIATSRAERALTAALISFAAETDAAIVAEGIESDRELRALRELGVRYGQGFHLGRPACLARPGLDERTA